MNSFAPVDPSLIDVKLPEDERGYPEHFMLSDREDGVLAQCCGAASRKFPKAWKIDPKDWADKARENDKNKTWPRNYVDRYTNQVPTHECTTHSLRTNFEAARNRGRGIIFPDGPKKNFRYAESATSGSVWASCQSIYAQVNPKTRRNPQQRGGASVRQVLEVACNTGFLPDKIQPREYGFRHSLHGTSGGGNSNQSSGPHLSVDDFPEGWEETAKLLRPLEVVFPESFEEAVCMILHGVVVSVGRDGHAVPWDFLVFNGDQLVNFGYDDSYNVTRYDSYRTAQSAWRGSFGIVTTTTPDDWLKPAG